MAQVGCILYSPTLFLTLSAFLAILWHGTAHGWLYSPTLFLTLSTSCRHRSDRSPWLVEYIFSYLTLSTQLFSSTIPTTIHLEVVSVTSSDLLQKPSSTSPTVARGDSWAIPVDNDILTPEPGRKLPEMEDTSSESKLMLHM